MELNERINEIETKNSQIIEIDQSLHVCMKYANQFVKYLIIMTKKLAQDF